MQGSSDTQGQNSTSSAGRGAGYTPGPPVGRRLRRGNWRAEQVTASLLALAPSLSAPHLPDFRGTSLLIYESVSLLLPPPGGDGAFQTFNRSWIQLPRTQGQEAQQSLLRTEIMYFLTKEHISASYCLIHFSRAVIIIVFVS